MNVKASDFDLRPCATQRIALPDGFRKEALGHTVNAPADIGSVQAVVVDAQTGKQYGAADARREGTVIGLPQPRGH